MAIASRRCTLQYGGEVPRDGNCLFQALAVAMGSFETASEVEYKKLPISWTSHTPCRHSVALKTGLVNFACPKWVIINLLMTFTFKLSLPHGCAGSGKMCVQSKAAAEPLQSAFHCEAADSQLVHARPEKLLGCGMRAGGPLKHTAAAA